MRKNKKKGDRQLNLKVFTNNLCIFFRKRKREKEIEEEEDREKQKEFAKNFEESREARVSSWQKFQSGETKKKKSKKTASSSFLPPKVKAETRN